MEWTEVIELVPHRESAAGLRCATGKGGGPEQVLPTALRHTLSGKEGGGEGGREGGSKGGRNGGREGGRREERERGREGRR